MLITLYIIYIYIFISRPTAKQGNIPPRLVKGYTPRGPGNSDNRTGAGRNVVASVTVNRIVNNFKIKKLHFFDFVSKSINGFRGQIAAKSGSY